MVKCEICGDEFGSKGARTRHLKSDHDMSLEDYVVITEYSEEPRCECGYCDKRPLFSRGSFSSYAKGHNTFKWREEQYIKHNGQPECQECGEPVGFKRGEPNTYCSSSCVGRNTGFSLEKTQEKIREVVRDKYGVDSVSQLDEVKAKISEARKGQKMPPRTEEWKKHHSKIMKDKWKDPEFREKSIQAIKEGWDDPEKRAAATKRSTEMWSDDDFRERMKERDRQNSKRMKERWANDDEFRKKALEALEDRDYDGHSDEVKERIAKSSRENWKDPEYRERVVVAVTEASNTPDEKARRSAFLKRRWQDPEYRESHQEMMREKWADPEFKAASLQRMAEGMTNRMSSLHQEIRKHLDLDELGFVPEQPIGRYIVDELHEDQGIVIEVNGDYVHANPDKYGPDDVIKLPGNSYTASEKWESDSRKIQALEEAGYEVVVIWKSDDWDDVSDQLEDLLG